MDTDALKRSWAQVAAHGDAVPGYFYAHLFLAHPEVRDMFPVTMAAQRDRLVRALGRMVSNVDDVGSVVGYIQDLGRDHRKFGTLGDHYPAVGASLLATLNHFLGDRWTPELADDWAADDGRRDDHDPARHRVRVPPGSVLRRRDPAASPAVALPLTDARAA